MQMAMISWFGQPGWTLFSNWEGGQDEALRQCLRKQTVNLLFNECQKTYPIFRETQSQQTYLGVDLLYLAQACRPDAFLSRILGCAYDVWN